MIETDRCIIRLPEPADVPEIVRYYRVNREHLQPFSPTFSSDFLDEQVWLQQVASRAREFALAESFRAFIFPRVSPASVIGNINLTNVVRGALQSCILGYNLDAGAQGHGYMAEAVRAMVTFAFDHWRLHRVAAGYMPRNKRSAAVLKRCGFKVEGRSPAFLRIDGLWEDHIQTAITNPSWTEP
jgi:[ribosomal protein S5]-alanine N-acetyltransferase